MNSIEIILEAAGLVLHRRQQKRRLSYVLDQVRFDFDTWPGVPTYLEIEGPDHGVIEDVVRQLGLNPDDADTSDARAVLLRYGIHLDHLNRYTFDGSEAA